MKFYISVCHFKQVDGQGGSWETVEEILSDSTQHQHNTILGKCVKVKSEQ